MVLKRCYSNRQNGVKMVLKGLKRVVILKLNKFIFNTILTLYHHFNPLLTYKCSPLTPGVNRQKVLKRC